ncbi:MAG: hypothetical protein DRI54_05195 [Bacteroidetes bacterium]|nr:MAG: hypothetical protein DRI54_05195 [Bacteroidota bacterium]
MRKLLSILMILLSIQAFAQDDKSKDRIDYSGEYNGTFTDIKDAEGTMQLFLYQPDKGRTSGIILLTRIVNGKSEVTTGTINIEGNGEFISGNFMPSEIKYIAPREDEDGIMQNTYDSYSCRWEIFGQITDKKGNTIIGKAVPANCVESNLIEFRINKKK